MGKKRGEEQKGEIGGGNEKSIQKRKEEDRSEDMREGRKGKDREEEKREELEESRRRRG